MDTKKNPTPLPPKQKKNQTKTQPPITATQATLLYQLNILFN